MSLNKVRVEDKLLRATVLLECALNEVRDAQRLVDEPGIVMAVADVEERLVISHTALQAFRTVVRENEDV